MIQDIIEYIDNEDEEGIILFLDQQKAFDRVEWEWIDFVLEKFEFGDKFRAWIKCYYTMLLRVSKLMGLYQDTFRLLAPLGKGVQ